MLPFLSFLIVSGMIFMGIGALLYMGLKTDSWLLQGVRPMWFKWREQVGFTRLEFIERTVNEMTGTPSPREQITQQFGPAAGCMSVLLFIPIQLFVTPFAYMVLDRRKRALRDRVLQLPREQRESLAEEYLEWLQV